MTYDLYRVDDDEWITFNIVAWPKLLDLARSYGWIPAGTRAPYYWDDDEEDDDEDDPTDFEGTPYPDATQYRLWDGDEDDPTDWDGNYWCNSAQLVTVEDARGLADALEKALDDIPDHPGMPPKMVNLSSINRETISPMLGRLFSLFEDEATVPNTNLNAYEFFGGEEKSQVRDFIAFCQRGSFEIC